tara:strand:- start:933 stop:1673 length:741 start_codon:yes stop_codon:yes gene_type:complete
MSKIAIVTGAGTGVGQVVAKKLSEDGMSVMLVGRRLEKLEETKAICTGNVEMFSLDVSKPDDVEKFYKNIESTYGRLDVLFNNAGVGIPAKTMDQISFDEWKYVVDINLNGMFLCAKYAFDLMKRQNPQGGRIINNGSVSSMTPRPGSIAYTSTKHAITGMTKTISLDGRPFKIVCSQIDIGNAETPMTQRMKEGVPQATGKTATEPVFDANYIADAISSICKMPLNTNVLNMTIMANDMPFVGRG